LGAATLGAMNHGGEGRIVRVGEYERTGNLVGGDTLILIMNRNEGNVEARCDHYGGTLTTDKGQLVCYDADF
jgi:hypothetical protein